MKSKMRQELRRELRGVKVSDGLRARILAEAGYPEKKNRSALGWLVAAAALILTVGIGAGMLSLRMPQTDIRPLSHGEGGMVWVLDGDDLYHARQNCGGMTGAVQMDAERARAQGRSACRECIAVVGTTSSTVEAGEIIALISVPTYVPDFAATPEPMPVNEMWTGATPEPTASPTEAPFPMQMDSESSVIYDAEEILPTVEPARYTPVPESRMEEGAIAEESSDAAPTETPAQMRTESESGVVYDAEEPLPTEIPENIQELKDGGTEAEDMTVYAAENGMYYHLEEKCSGSSGMSEISLAQAMQQGKANCPVCIGDGTVRILRTETVQADGWASFSTELATQVEWIEGEGRADMDDGSVRRILSWLSPNYMSVEQAEEFMAMLNAGEIKGFRSTICTPVAADSDRYEAKYTFFETDDETRTVTLLLEGAEDVDLHEIRVHCEIMTVEFIFEESGVVDNSTQEIYSVRHVNADGSLLVLTGIDGVEEQKPIVSSVAELDPVQVQQQEIGGMEVRRVKLGGRIYLLPAGDAYAAGTLEILKENMEECRNLLETALNVPEETLICGFRQKSAEKDWWSPACFADGEALAEPGGVTASYWATKNGVYYHSVRNCSGMRNAMQVFENELDELNKKPCPVCLDSEPVWMQEYGSVFHADKVCAGEGTLIEISMAEAEQNGAKPCPDCR